jgi:hypothetical protein
MERLTVAIAGGPGLYTAPAGALMPEVEEFRMEYLGENFQ